ncbi:MAG: 50S ribosomal protein L23 [Bacteroidetes bacterium]|nr:50S ribosomal protein L23 [Bacteroidota bacterium]
MKTILIKPLLTEKLTLLQEKQNKYSFQVSKDANKIEIKKAVEEKYSVTVTGVNTSLKDGKVKIQMTKKGLLVGKKDDLKKAVVTLKTGDSIDFLKNT